MELRSDMAVERALLAEDLGRQLRAELYVTLLVKAALALARIGRWGVHALASRSRTPVSGPGS